MESLEHLRLAALLFEASAKCCVLMWMERALTHTAVNNSRRKDKLTKLFAMKD